MTRVTVPEPVRRRIGTALLALVVALVPVAGVAALAASSRGLFGQISHAWQSLVSTHSVVYDTPGRIAQLGSSRPAYWHQALDVGSHALLKGVGELGYGIARLRYTTSTAKADQAHSYLFQTFADLGLIGVVLTLALLVAWCRAAARPLAIGTPLARADLRSSPASARDWSPWRSWCVVFGIQSLPGLHLLLPGRGDSGAAVRRLAGRSRAAGGARRAPGRAARVGAGAARSRRRSSPAWSAVALIGAWVMWQPLRSAQAMAAAREPAGHRVCQRSRRGEPRPALDRAPVPALGALSGDQRSTRGAGGTGEGHPAAARESSTLAVAGAARPRHRAPRRLRSPRWTRCSASTSRSITTRLAATPSSSGPKRQTRAAGGARQSHRRSVGLEQRIGQNATARSLVNGSRAEAAAPRKGRASRHARVTFSATGRRSPHRASQ